MPQMAPMAPIDDFGSGWYLRGDVGVGIQSFEKFDHFATNPAFVWPASWLIDHKGINDTAFVGAGIGFQFNNWLRFDVTGEYRITSRFHAVGGYTEFCAGGGRCFDNYDGNHSSTVFLANAYFDLGNWYRFTPFVGVGAGVARHSITGLWDLGLNSDGSTGRGFASDRSEWQFAWAVHAGVAYDLSQNVKIELAYRYLNMGDVRTGIIDCIGWASAARSHTTS
jgi:opacity protein-like surface antigen